VVLSRWPELPGSDGQEWNREENCREISQRYQAGPAAESAVQNGHQQDCVAGEKNEDGQHRRPTAELSGARAGV